MPIHTLVLFIITCAFAYLIYNLLSNREGLELVLLGIEITLVGGILAVDPDSYLGGAEYILVLGGLIVSIFSLRKSG